MAYFPLFIELENEICLIIGDGTVAKRKAEVLKKFGAKTVICGIGEWELSDCLNAVLVIAATDSREWNHMIAGYCREHAVPVNVADSREESTFLFPAVVERGLVTVGITTSGSSPKLSSDIRRQVEEIVTEQTGILAENMGRAREIIKELPEELPERKAHMNAVYQMLQSVDHPLTEGELRRLTDEVLVRSHD